MSDYYILENGAPKKVSNVLEWAKWFETSRQDHSRRVGDDKAGDVRISTVFLGLDHFFGESTQPVLFETMIFGGARDQDQRRYCTLEEAKAGHAEWVAEVRAAELPKETGK